jgi:TonB family protein
MRASHCTGRTSDVKGCTAVLLQPPLSPTLLKSRRVRTRLPSTRELRLPAGGAMHPLPNYPADALTHRAHGICQMHIAVLASGAVSSIEFRQSTGSEALDQACKEAIYQSPFVPAAEGGQPVSGTTEVAILWRLPRP